MMLLAIQYCVLLKYCMDSKCVPDIMQCFRSMGCCVFRKSIALEVLRQIPWLFMQDSLVAMGNKNKIK